jgi:hypothetical protein
LLNAHNIPTIRVQFESNDSDRRYNAPVVSEIAGFVLQDSMTFDCYRSVHLNNLNGNFSCIHELNGAYDPTHYVLMFPDGDYGYSLTRDKPSGVTPLKFYRQRIQVRKNNDLGIFGRLFHEYVIDQACKVEKANLDYIRRIQRTLRMSTRQTEPQQEGTVGQKEGRSCACLPASFQGGPRYMRAKYLDGLNAANKVGGASYVITMTANPNWIEIQRELQPYETAVDRPDIVSRIFKLKLTELIDDLTQKHVLGY